MSLRPFHTRALRERALRKDGLRRGRRTIVIDTPSAADYTRA